MKITGKTMEQVKGMVAEILGTHEEAMIKAFMVRGGELKAGISVNVKENGSGAVDIGVDISYETAAKVKDKIELNFNENQGKLPLEEGSVRGADKIYDIVKGQLK